MAIGAKRFICHCNLRANAIAALCLLALLCSQSPVQASKNGPGTNPVQEQPIDPSYYPEKSNGDGDRDSGMLLKGEITYTVPQGTPIKLKIATVPSAGLHLLDRDMDGNLIPARPGERLTARITEDICVDNNKVIPEGSLLVGYVSKIYPPKRMYRSGYLEIQFVGLKLPDGREFCFKVTADNKKASTPKTKARGFGRLMAYSFGGGVVGAVAAYKVTGMHITTSTHGLNIAAGAAAGALIATTYAALKKGRPAVLEPGDDLNMNIDADLLMPVAQKPTAKKPLKHMDGLDVRVLKTKRKSDGLDGIVLVTDLEIENQTRSTIRSMDIFLEDTNGTRNPVVVPYDDESELNWEVQPYSMDRVHASFQMEWPKLKHRIVILDHNTRKPVHIVKVD